MDGNYRGALQDLWAAEDSECRLRAVLERWCKAWEHGNGGERCYAYEKAREALRGADETSAGYQRLPCPECGKLVNLTNYGRCWHCNASLPREKWMT
jgi:hypothetical protein